MYIELEFQLFPTYLVNHVSTNSAVRYSTWLVLNQCEGGIVRIPQLQILDIFYYSGAIQLNISQSMLCFHSDLLVNFSDSVIPIVAIISTVHYHSTHEAVMKNLIKSLVLTQKVDHFTVFENFPSTNCCSQNSHQIITYI